MLASNKVGETETRQPDPELCTTLLNLVRWMALLSVKLSDLMEVPCPDCLFPLELTKERPTTVMIQMLERGDFRCTHCGLTLKSPLSGFMLDDRLPGE